MHKLPTFRGYTVDVRLKQFRKVHWDTQGNPAGIDVIPFLSEEGLALLKDYIPAARRRYEVSD